MGRDTEGAQGQLQGEFLLNALGRIGQSLEQLQACGEMIDRFGVSVALDGALSGLLPIPDRPRIVPPPLKVHGQLGGNLSRLLAIPLLFSLPNLPMQAHPPSG